MKMNREIESFHEYFQFSLIAFFEVFQNGIAIFWDVKFLAH